jgi:serine/threonine-protein kinase
MRAVTPARSAAKEPERRYDAATALAADLARYLMLLPVLAGPPSFRYRLRKMLRRYLGQIVAVAAMLLAITGTSQAGLPPRNRTRNTSSPKFS